MERYEEQCEDPEENEFTRVTALNNLIYDTYDLATDEIEILENQYERSTTRLFQIRHETSRGFVIDDLKKLTEYKPVLFPPPIAELLRSDDIFYGTIGRREKQWHLIYMTPLYDIPKLGLGPDLH